MQAPAISSPISHNATTRTHRNRVNCTTLRQGGTTAQTLVTAVIPQQHLAHEVITPHWLKDSSLIHLPITANRRLSQIDGKHDKLQVLCTIFTIINVIRQMCSEKSFFSFLPY